MNNNAFLKKQDEYIRDHDIIGNYTRILSKHLSSKYEKPLEEVTTWVKGKLETKFKPKDPTIHVLRKDKNKDRFRAKTTLQTFLNWVDRDNLVLGPNLVVYENYKKEKSFLSEFVLGNLNKRAETKDLMSNYFASKQEALGNQMNLLQSNYKLFNNSISGATSSPHNSLYCASSHTTLTSICRACTSFANATNEKFLASNRVYFTLDDALANMADIASRTDLVETERVMEKYDIAYPSVDQLLNVVMDSLKLYNVTNLSAMSDVVKQVIDGYTPAERAAVCYVGDLNALKDSNDTFLRKFIGKILYKPTVPHSDPDTVLKNAYEDVKILASLLNASYTRGTGIKNIKKSDPETYALYAAHVESIGEHLDTHKDFIHMFLSAHTVPHNLHSVPLMTRKAVVGSDTDSSIFSVQELTKWHEGTYDFSDEADAVSAVFAFMATQVTGNAMLMLSRQLGVREDQFYRLEMKSEYFMPVLSLSNAQKHYVYLMGAKEQNVYAKDKLDVKGLGYKNSRVPTEIMELTNRWYYGLLMAVRNNRKLTPQEILSIPAYVEHSIINSILDGAPDVYLHAKIKDKDQYAKPMSSIYAMLDLWNNTFSAKYGMVTEVPCSGIKANVALPNKAAIVEWTDSLDDVDLAESIMRWCKLNNRWSLSSIVVPNQVITSGRLPKEIVSIVDKNRVLSDMTSQFYLFLTTFGIYMGNDKGSDWAYETLTLEEAKANAIVPLEL